MSILDELDQLARAIADGKAEIRQEVAEGLAKLEARADQLVAAIQGAMAKTFEVVTAKGHKITVSQRDAMLLFAASVKCLNRQNVTLTLDSGQTEEFAWHDLDHLADEILKASNPPAAAGP